MKDKLVLAGELSIWTCSEIEIKEIKELLKKSKLNLKDARLYFDLDYSVCYYEGDSPKITIKVYGKK